MHQWPRQRYRRASIANYFSQPELDKVGCNSTRLIVGEYDRGCNSACLVVGE
jgi:hypothetical protein